MKDKKDISDLFRDNQYKLNEVPSPQTWQRLERRLDARSSRRRGDGVFVSGYWLATAAAVALLVAVFVFSTRPSLQPGAQLAARPVALEQLVDTDASPDMLSLIDHQRNYRQGAAGSIDEGLNSQRLEVARSAEKSSQVTRIFSWLPGTWVGEEKDGSRSTDVWEATDANTLRGSGTLHDSSGELILAETMRIEQEGERISLWIQLTDGGQPVPYQLQEYAGASATFVNKGLSWPQMLLLRKTDSRTLQVVYQNNEPKTSNRYLGLRNGTQQERMVRTLRAADVSLQ